MNGKVLVAGALALVLGGCTYVHSYLTESDMSDATAFCEKLRADPAIRPVAGKLPLISPDEITPEMLTIETTPTDTEIDAIKALSRDQQECRKRLRAVTKVHEPAQVAAHDELDMKLDLVTAGLLQKKMTYAAANRLYREAALEASNKLSEQAKDEAADADERQQATWRALGQSLAGAAKPAAPKADKSCSWIDSSTECSSH